MATMQKVLEDELEAVRTESYDRGKAEGMLMVLGAMAMIAGNNGNMTPASLVRSTVSWVAEYQGLIS